VLHIDAIDFYHEIRVFMCFSYILPTLPREMAPCTCQQPTPHIPATNNTYGALVDLSEDQISPSSNTQHRTNLRTYPSSNANLTAISRFGPTAPFVFSTDPTSVHDDMLRIALSRHLMDGFIFMNSHIKGLVQNLKDAEGRHEEFRRQINNHLNEMTLEDMDMPMYQARMLSLDGKHAENPPSADRCI
jgi:hypothetical protein